MSRIGKKPVPIPSGVTANVEGQTVKVKGPKGAMQVVLPDDVEIKMDAGAVQVDPRNETKRARAMWGTSRTLVANLVTGSPTRTCAKRKGLKREPTCPVSARRRSRSPAA